VARVDLFRESRYLAERSLEARERFLSAAEETFDLLATSPELGGLVTIARAEDLRVWRIRGFPNHLVFYRQTAKSLDIVRILYGARDWATILEDL
jgi:toxin ParE1/3/4